MKKKVEALDPTLPFTEIAIGGKIYKMCLDHGALCEAESQLIRTHPEVNLLNIYTLPSGNTSRVVFAMSLHRFHPEIAYEDALKLVTAENAVRVASATMSLYRDSMPEAAEGAVSDPQ